MLVANLLEEGVFGGPQKRVALVAEALQHLDDDPIQTVVLGPTDADRFMTECSRRGVTYHPVAVSALSRRPRLLVRYLLGARRETKGLVGALRHVGADLAHCSGGAWSVKTCIAARRAGVPFVWHMNDASQPLPVRAVLWVLIRVLRPAGVVYSGARTRDYYRDLFPAGIPEVIARPPIEVLDRRDGQGEGSESTPALCRLGRWRLVLIGNVNPTKDTLLAVEAARSLIEEGLDLSLTLLGEVKSSQQAYFASVREAGGRHWGDRIVYGGPVDSVGPYLRAADLALCTSVSEAGPMSAWEAAAAGCPLISTDVGDVDALLGQERGVLISPPGDLGALLANLRRALSEPDANHKRADEARRRVATLAADEVARATAEFYRDIHRITGSTTCRDTHQSTNSTSYSANEKGTEKHGSSNHSH